MTNEMAIAAYVLLVLVGFGLGLEILQERPHATLYKNMRIV
jgi:hypothetical protein